MISDEQIAAMSPAQRRELISRLERPFSEMVPAAVVDRLRRAHVGLMVIGTIVLIPWIVYLAFRLPGTYAAHDWSATWIGFDIVLVAFMVATAVLGWLRRLLVVLTAFTTGVLLMCDAWFDIMTAGPGETATTVASAFLAELPLAFIQIAGTLRIMRLYAGRRWAVDKYTPLWRLPLRP